MSLLARLRRPATSAHRSLSGGLCCKSPKLKSDNFPARRQSKSRSLIDMASISLPKSPVSLSLGDKVPDIFTRKARPRLEEISISSAKRLLQHTQGLNGRGAVRRNRRQ